jgi:hypothetical protein
MLGPAMTDDRKMEMRQFTVKGVRSGLQVSEDLLGGGGTGIIFTLPPAQPRCHCHCEISNGPPIQELCA